MSDSLYMSCCQIAGIYLRREVWESASFAQVVEGVRWGKVSKAVYVVLDVRNRVAYVGSVDRLSESGLAGRLYQHSRLRGRAHWYAVRIVPLRDGTPRSKVVELEGTIGRRLRPYDNQRLPL